MSAPAYYIQNIKEWREDDLEKRIKMMEDRGYVVLNRGKELKSVRGRLEYYAVMRLAKL